jgi:methylmalonyl-CoA/ethylmalonyl-CoA epimerase
MSDGTAVAASDELKLRLHHVGYAVADIATYLKDYIVPLFQPKTVTEIVEDPIQRVRIAFVQVPGGSLELIEPMSPDSPVQKILSRQRGGLYHVAYATPAFDRGMTEMVAKGCRPLAKPVPAAAFDQRRIVFFMTPHFDLVELVEMPETASL